VARQISTLRQLGGPEPAASGKPSLDFGTCHGGANFVSFEVCNGFAACHCYLPRVQDCQQGSVAMRLREMMQRPETRDQRRRRTPLAQNDHQKKRLEKTRLSLSWRRNFLLCFKAKKKPCDLGFRPNPAVPEWGTSRWRNRARQVTIKSGSGVRLVVVPLWTTPRVLRI